MQKILIDQNRSKLDKAGQELDAIWKIPSRIHSHLHLSGNLWCSVTGQYTSFCFTVIVVRGAIQPN